MINLKLSILDTAKLKGSKNLNFSIMLDHHLIWLHNHFRQMFIIKKLKFGQLESYFMNVSLEGP